MKSENERPPTTGVAEGSEGVRDQRTVSVSTITPTSPTTSRARGQSTEAPFIWMATDAIERIKKQIGITKGATALAVYVGLCCHSNDKEVRSSTFQATVSQIATASALGYRATEAALKLLKDAGVILIKDNGRHPSGSTYTILSFVRKGGTLNKKSFVRKGERGFPLDEARRVQTVPNKLSLSKEKERVANKEDGGMNNHQTPDAATPARLDGAGAAGVADTRPAAVKPQPRRW